MTNPIESDAWRQISLLALDMQQATGDNGDCRMSDEGIEIHRAPTIARIKKLLEIIKRYNE